MVDQSQLTLDIFFESVLQVCRKSHLPKSLFGPVAIADLPRRKIRNTLRKVHHCWKKMIYFRIILTAEKF